MAKRILLTGGNGFIGRNIQEQMNSAYQVFAPSSSELNLLNEDDVDAYLARNGITHVIHAAVFNRRRRESNPDMDLSANLKMFFHLAKHSPNLDKILYFGSGVEYDKRYPIHMAEETCFGQKIPLLNDYGLSKYLMNLQTMKSENIYNLRLFGIFGKYEDWRNCFISNLCCKAVFDLPLTIRKECRFDFLYIDDLMPVLKWFLENTPQYHDYNVCTGMPVRLTEIAAAVKRVSGKSLDIVLLSEGENLEYTGCSERLRAEFDMKCERLELSIQKLYAYYESVRDQIDFNILKHTR